MNAFVIHNKVAVLNQPRAFGVFCVIPFPSMSVCWPIYLTATQLGSIQPVCIFGIFVTRHIDMLTLSHPETKLQSPAFHECEFTDFS